MMEGSKQNFNLPQSIPMNNNPDRRVLAIRVLKVSQPNRHHSFPSTTRPRQIRSSNSIHVPITSNNYSSPLPPTPCNTPSYSERSPVMKKYIVIRKRQSDQNDEHSPNILKSPDLLNNAFSKTNSPDTYSQSTDNDLKTNCIQKKICHWISTNIYIILCILTVILINGAICGAIIGLLFSKNLL